MQPQQRLPAYISKFVSNLLCKPNIYLCLGVESGDHKILIEIQATMILSQATNCKKNKGPFAENNQLDSFVQFCDFAWLYLFCHNN